MNKFDWTFIGALVSVALGWFLNELGQWLRTRKEDKKTKKQVLFYLLETHFIFIQLDTFEIKELLNKKALSFIPKEDQTEELKLQIDQLFARTLKGLSQENVSDKLDQIEEQYSYAVAELAKVDPITAYRLKGKTKILETMEMLHDHFEELKGNFPGDEDIFEKQIAITMDEVEPTVFIENLKEIENEIKSIAFSINFWTWIEAKKTLRRMKNRVKNEGEERIDSLLEKLIPQARTVTQ